MLQEMKEESGITPMALLNRPVLDDRLMLFYREYLSVARSRTFSDGGGPYPLQWRAFLDYCTLEDIEPSSRPWLWSGVKLFDDAWVTLARTKLQADAAAAKSK